MSVTSNRSVYINLTGDLLLNNTYEAAENSTAIGSITVHELSSGDNTITTPAAGGLVVKGATILPPSGNTQTITLKGVTGDTGIVLSKLDPTSIAFDTAPTDFLLVAGGTISGLRIVWT